ncbi:hypothetical protein [Bacillus altitudinis]|nr:hypothetical protein [Bacillus altitudinis]MCY7439382.1 hypothetical protein [Bacillus altitudinis]MEC1142420.1 hypothetical protein [Bacillus altitudinis]
MPTRKQMRPSRQRPLYETLRTVPRIAWLRRRRRTVRRGWIGGRLSPSDA